MAASSASAEFAEQMNRISRPDTTRWLLGVTVDWAMVVCAMMLFYYAFFEWTHPLRWAACFIAIVSIGVFQHRLALMGHDGVPHGCISRKRKINDFLAGLLAFWPIGFAVEGYRVFHLNHHAHVGTAQDPEWKGHKSVPRLMHWKLPFRPINHALRIVGDLLVVGSAPHILRAMKLVGPRSVQDALGPIVTITGAVALCWWLDALWIPVIWFIALWTSFWACFRTRLWIEHAGRELVGHEDEHTYRVDVPVWLRWAISPHNGDCHWEHHFSWDSPEGRKCWSVPVWNLRKARRLISEHGLGPRVLSFKEFMRLVQAPESARSEIEGEATGLGLLHTPDSPRSV